MIIDIDEILKDCNLNFDNNLRMKELLYKDAQRMIVEDIICRCYTFKNRNIIASELPKYKNTFKYSGGSIENCTMEGDFSEYNFSKVSLKNVKFSEDARLPSDRSFFKKLNDMKVDDCTLPCMDYSKYDFENVTLNNVIFPHDAILPKDRNFFKNLELFSWTKFPKIDMNDYNFDRVSLRGIRFTQDTILPQDKDFFLKIESRDISYAEVPSGDYSGFNFKNVSVRHTVFPRDAKLPMPNGFFDCLIYNGIEGCTLPALDYSEVDFSHTDLKGVVFPRDAILPNDTELFQKTYYCLERTVLPYGDYSKFNFNDRKFDGTIFTSDSILPINLFEQINLKTSFVYACSWPIQFIRDVILLEIPDGIHLDLTKSEIPAGLLRLLHAKYRNDKRVGLPKLE